MSCVVQDMVVDLEVAIYNGGGGGGGGGDKISAYITLPPTYPPTALGLQYRGRTIFVFSFTLQKRLRSARHHKLLHPDEHPDDGKPMCMFIDELYFYPKTANVSLTPEEQDIFRGVAKRAAKLVLTHLAPRLPPSTTLVCLEASGTIRSRRQQDARERELEQGSTEDLLALVAQHGILDTADFYGNLSAPITAQFKNGQWTQWPRRDWQQYLLPPVLYAEDNVLLAQYYTRNFSMDIIDDSHKISQIFMATTLDKMLAGLGRQV